MEQRPSCMSFSGLLPVKYLALGTLPLALIGIVIAFGPFPEQL